MDAAVPEFKCGQIPHRKRPETFDGVSGFEITRGHAPEKSLSHVAWMVHVRHQEARDRGVPPSVAGVHVPESIDFSLNIGKPSQDGEHLSTDRMLVKRGGGLPHEPLEHREQRGGFHGGREGWMFTDWVGLLHQKQT